MLKVTTSSVSATQIPSAAANNSAMSIPVSKKAQKHDPFYNSPNNSPQSQSPLHRFKAHSTFSSPPRDNLKGSPQRPTSFGQFDVSPKASPSSSPRTRPASIDTSFARLNTEKPTVKLAGSSISNPRPQRRLKSILKQTTDSPTLASPAKSKIHFNTTMEHICHFSKNDFPCEIRDSPRTTIDDSGDMDAITASAGWEALDTPVVNTWTVLSSNHSSIVKMALSDAIHLESSRVQGDTLIGGIIVRNYAFHKTVTVRYTIDNWASSNDIIADYCNSIKNVSNDAYGLDRFTFTISLPDLVAELDSKEPITICYALQYSVASRTYWDNNRGANYEITVVNNPGETQSSASQETKPWWETSVPKPRQRTKRSGLKKSVSASTLETRNVAIEKPFNSLASNFAGNTNSRIEDAFASPHLPPRVNIKVVIPQNSLYSALETPLGSSPNYGSSIYGSSFLGMGDTLTHISKTAPILLEKSAKVSKLYGDDFYMTSPPSSFSRS